MGNTTNFVDPDTHGATIGLHVQPTYDVDPNSLKPVNRTSLNGTISSINAVTSSTTLLAINVGRLAAYFYNDSSAILYLALSSSSATTTNYTVQIAPGGFFSLPLCSPMYTGVVKGLWASAAGAVRITELS